MNLSIIVTVSGETPRRTVGSYVFNCCLEGSSEYDIVRVVWRVELADVAMVGFDVLYMFLRQPCKEQFKLLEE